VSLDDRADDREADAGSATLARARGVDAIEALEDPVEVLGGDALAVATRRGVGTRAAGPTPEPSPPIIPP
jgi:hypothetical protein